MKTKDLGARIEALEAVPVMTEQAGGANGEFIMSEFMQRLEREQADYAALDAAGRIRHWRRAMVEAEAIIASGGGPLGPLPNGCAIDLRENRRALKLMSARDDLVSQFPFNLVQAQLDRLGELGYDGAKLAAWRAMVNRYADLPWQWRPQYLELPADALARLA